MRNLQSDVRQEELIEEFSLFDEWMDKYEHIIEMGKELESIPEEMKSDDNLVRGCQSRVWLNSEMNGPNLIFKADSDALITKGLVAMMVRILSNRPPSEIVETELYFVDKIGLKEHLSPNRSNGLANMIKKMKLYALGFMSKMENSQ